MCASLVLTLNSETFKNMPLNVRFFSKKGFRLHFSISRISFLFSFYRPPKVPILPVSQSVLDPIDPSHPSLSCVLRRSLLSSLSLLSRSWSAGRRCRSATASTADEVGRAGICVAPSRPPACPPCPLQRSSRQCHRATAMLHVAIGEFVDCVHRCVHCFRCKLTAHTRQAKLPWHLNRSKNDAGSHCFRLRLEDQARPSRRAGSNPALNGGADRADSLSLPGTTTSR